MIISNNIFLIRRFFRNLGHLDLKLVEGKRSGSWRTSTICLHGKCIGWIGFWTVSHPWMACDGGLQDISACFCWTSCQASWNRNLFLESIAKTFTEHPKAPMPKKRSHLNLTFHLEWCYKNRIRNFLFHITKAEHALMMLNLWGKGGLGG